MTARRREPSTPEGARTSIRITLDGEPLEARVGQTIAGALLARGTLEWRGATRDDAPRGVFCGIGVCFDCLVEVDGVRDVRACQRRVADGQSVVTQRGLRVDAPQRPRDPAPSAGEGS